MAQTFQEGRIRFGFADSWMVLRPEETSYYNRHFQSFAGGCKAVDFVLFHPNASRLWLLEIKDYTTDPRTKSLDLFLEVALKARDSLALLLGAAANDSAGSRLGGVPSAGEFMRTAGLPAEMGVVLHLEQPAKPSKLFPGVKVKADSTQKLRQMVRCVDPHAAVVSTSFQHPLWTSDWCP